jgi:methylated-DNA-[protein]-cysteine S-methyltransferase
VKPTPHPERLFLSEVATPIGALLCVTDDAGAWRVAEWADDPERFDRLLRRHCSMGPQSLVRRGLSQDAAAAIGGYFEGEVGALDRLDVSIGGTEFQLAVWRALRVIPAGETISYTELARRAGRPTASRAAGAANAANPLTIVVPCHRAIGSNGDLTGYAGGLERKRWLLAHESGAGRS